MLFTNRIRTTCRGVAVVAALSAVVLTITACGAGGSAGSGGGGAHSGKRIAIVMPESVPGYAKQIGCGAYQEGTRLGFEVGKPQAPAKAQDAAAQAQIMQSVLARKPDGLIFSAADAKAGGVAIKPSVRQGLPVVAVDVALADPSLAISFVSSSHEEGGKLGGGLLAKQIGGKGKVAAIGVLPSNPITQGRIKGFREAMKDQPGVDVVGVKYPDYAINKITAEASALLSRYPDLKGIYTSNDVIASGVAAALRQAGKVGKVKVITWDLQPTGIKLLREGTVTGTVAQRPREQGKFAIRQLANKLDGKPVQKAVTVPVTTVENTQVDAPKTKALYYSNDC